MSTWVLSVVVLGKEAMVVVSKFVIWRYKL